MGGCCCSVVSCKTQDPRPKASPMSELLSWCHLLFKKKLAAEPPENNVCMSAFSLPDHYVWRDISALQLPNYPWPKLKLGSCRFCLFWLSFKIAVALCELNSIIFGVVQSHSALCVQYLLLSRGLHEKPLLKVKVTIAVCWKANCNQCWNVAEDRHGQHKAVVLGTQQHVRPFFSRTETYGIFFLYICFHK